VSKQATLNNYSIKNTGHVNSVTFNIQIYAFKLQQHKNLNTKQAKLAKRDILYKSLITK